MTQKILVTTALPYANGDIHLGHLMEHIQTDIWVRFQRQCGNDCVYVCADDAHGTATTITAEKQGVAVMDWIAKMRASHEQDLRAFGMSYDNYYTTHSEENKELSEYIYTKLLEKNMLNKRVVKQLYDPEKKMFLADRFIKGTCPKCDTADQYGDNCECCGSTYDALDLKAPRSLLSGSKPLVKESEHLFFDLNLFAKELQEWHATGSIQKEVRNKLNEWFQEGLKEWNISRDAPYFGWPIPGYKDKYFYVWLDAPVGYMASLKNLCAQKGWDFDKDFWRNDKCKIYHFIGKDIIYFHTLFWPALLSAAEYNKPTGVFAHGFLTVNGEKMSKSRGTFILASKYLKHLDPEYLRYYFASKLGDGIDDMDFNTKEFAERINSDLIGKYVNIASRCARFINRDFGDKLADPAEPKQQELLMQLSGCGDEIAELYENRKYAMAVRKIMDAADQVNRYLSDEKPWELSKNDASDPRVQQICSTGINAFWALSVYLAPIAPQLAERGKDSFALPGLDWSHLGERLPNGHSIKTFKPLLERVPPEQLEELISVD